MKWYHTLKAHIAGVLILQIVMVSVLAGFSLYQLDFRKHDYAVLNLSGQLRVISQALLSQSQNYKKVAPRDYESYYRDLNLYHKDILKYTQQFNEIIVAFENRNLSAELLGRDETITCDWDEASRDQLNRTAVTWRQFKSGLENALGEDLQEPRLEYAAEYIIQYGTELQSATESLSSAFQIMMESKLDNIRAMNTFSIAVFMLLNTIILTGFIYKVFKPLDRTRESFYQVANGDLSFQVEDVSKNEIGDLVSSFNFLTHRLSTLFRLTDRIHQANSLDDSLKFFYEEFKGLLHIDWIGLVHYSPEKHQFVIDRIHTTSNCNLLESQGISSDETILNRAANELKPVNFTQIDTQDHGDLVNSLQKCEMKSILALPLETVSKDTVILVLAAKEEGIYQQKHMELLENISAQLSHSLDKTIGMEGLVISTIEGLAKLAESRDPETGDHLTRMSLYSSIIAEQLLIDSAYSNQISSSFVRDVFRFAPMHDIGKVGIEDNILLKPGRLTEEERQEMEKHPTIGADVLRRCENQINNLGHSVFAIGIEIAESHHERFDGSGYPNGLEGQDIPLSARIVATADVFDALTSKRPYKEAWPVEKALAIMQEESGKHFDPEVLKAFELAMPRVIEIYHQHKHV